MPKHPVCDTRGVQADPLVEQFGCAVLDEFVGNA
jgi:hypothetical protein